MKKCRFPSLLAAVILLAALFLPMSAAAVEDPGLTCRNAILIDATYDEVLYDKGAYDKVYPASITKVMTALLVLEAVDAGQLTLDTPITATAEALEVPEGSSTAKIQVGDTYTVEQDSLNIRKYTVRPTSKLLPGYEYYLKVPHRKFKDINGFYNDSSEVKVMLPNDDKLSSLNLVLDNVHNKYIIDLLNEKRDQTIRSFIVEKDTTLLFPYIKTGKYSIRLTEDLNRNGLVDTGNLLEHKQPEKVKFFKLDDGTAFLEIPEMTELEQSIDVGEMFK